MPERTEFLMIRRLLSIVSAAACLAGCASGTDLQTIAEAVIDCSESHVDYTHYAGSVFTQALAEYAACTGSRTDMAEAITDRFLEGSLVGTGSFISYFTGGTLVPEMVLQGYGKAAGLSASTARRMWEEQARNRDGVMLPAWTNPHEKNSLFIDCVLAATPYLLYAGLAENKPEYLDYAAWMTLKTFEDLRDPESGLVHQARAVMWMPEGQVTEDCWSRGNGWGAMALAALLKDLPKDNRYRSDVENLSRNFFEAVLRYQDPEGLWHQEMTYPDSYPEISGSGLLLYGIGRAIEAGVLDRSRLSAFRKGIEGMLTYVDANGNIGNTCSGCLAWGDGSKDAYAAHEYYCNERHAFGPVLFALTEALSLGIRKVVTDLGRNLERKRPECRVRFVRERKGDIAWENDLAAFRIYSQEVKDKVSSGVDYWGKRVDYPIIDEWYALNDKGLDYHTDRGQGRDFYAVGKNRGTGGLGIWTETGLLVPEPYESFSILEDRPERVAFEVTYPPIETEKASYTLSELIEMVPGTSFFRKTPSLQITGEGSGRIAVGLTDFGAAKVSTGKGVLSLMEDLSPAEATEGDGTIACAVIADPEACLGFETAGKDHLMLLNPASGSACYVGVAWDRDLRHEHLRTQWADILRKNTWRDLETRYRSFSSGNQGFGHWEEDPAGAPVYHYTGDLPFRAVDGNGNPTEHPEDPYFLLGNYRIGIIPHVSGLYECLTAQRGWARVNASPDKPDYAGIDACLEINGEQLPLAGMKSLAADGTGTERTFGIGFASWKYRLPDGVRCTRTLSVRPSEEMGGGFPCFSMDILLENNGTEPVRLVYRESIPIDYTPMHLQMQKNKSIRYDAHCTGDGSFVQVSFSPVPAAFTLIPGKEENSRSDYYPAPWFIAPSDDAGHVAGEGNALTYRSEIVLRGGESRLLGFVAGEGSATPLPSFLSDSEYSPFGRFANTWRQCLPDFSAEEDPVLRREMNWNAHFVEASAKYNAYYGETLIPQGSVYSYHYGDNIAARDVLQALLPACYTHPALAKSALRYMLMHTHPDGEIERGDSGYGYVSPTIYQESDPQLYMFMAVGEYLRITEDYAFLDEQVALSPAEYGHKDSVINLLSRHFLYLRDVVGKGPHGLVRLLNSDWSDSFLHRYSPNTTLHEAESHLNSTMALAVLPTFVEQLRKGGKKDLADAVEAYRNRLLPAFLDALGERPYCPRAYVAGHLFGDNSVCIEPHSYLFAIPEIPAARKREIYRRIYPALADSWGLRTREKPLWGKAPEGEDGGVWFALEYPLLLGVSTFDPNEASRLLKQFSFDRFAQAHPNYWIGHWTAPDELNSSLSREGLYAFWTGMKDYRLCFQGWCSHPHTWPLYCYLKLQERPR